jgi:hypothetical protein
MRNLCKQRIKLANLVSMCTINTMDFSSIVNEIYARTKPIFIIICNYFRFFLFLKK